MKGLAERGTGLDSDDSIYKPVSERVSGPLDPQPQAQCLQLGPRPSGAPWWPDSKMGTG